MGAAAAELNQPEHSGKIPDKSAKFAKTDEANGAVVAICRSREEKGGKLGKSGRSSQQLLIFQLVCLLFHLNNERNLQEKTTDQMMDDDHHCDNMFVMMHHR